MNAHEPIIDVMRLRPAQWVWACWNPECHQFTSDEYRTQPEAFAAALAHCAEAGKS